MEENKSNGKNVKWLQIILVASNGQLRDKSTQKPSQ